MEFPIMKRHWASLALAFLLIANSASAERREFTFLIDTVVDNRGSVMSARMVERGVNREFRHSIERLVRQWRFKPATNQGIPVSTRTTLSTEVIVELDSNQSGTMTARYVDHGPRKQRTSAPSYPEEALEARLSAEVELHITIGRDGRPKHIEMYSVRASQNNYPLVQKLVENSIKAARKWRFVAEQIDGQGIESKVLVPIKFSIDGSQSSLDWFWASERLQEVLVRSFQERLHTATRGFLSVGNATGLELVSDGSQG